MSKALAEEGYGCLPLILVDGRIVSRCSYPTCGQVDRLILGRSGEETALRYRAELVTSDADLKGLPGVRFIPK